MSLSQETRLDLMSEASDKLHKTFFEIYKNLRLFHKISKEDAYEMVCGLTGGLHNATSNGAEHIENVYTRGIEDLIRNTEGGK